MDYLVDSIAAATADIFQSMLMMEVRALTAEGADGFVLDESVCAAIQLEGLYRGSIEVLTPAPVALEITGNFLGLPVEQIDDDVRDAIGELANMVAGNLKLALSEKGLEIKLSVPETRVLPGYTYAPQACGRAIIVPFDIGKGKFLVTLRLAETG